MVAQMEAMVVVILQPVTIADYHLSIVISGMVQQGMELARTLEITPWNTSNFRKAKEGINKWWWMEFLEEWSLEAGEVESLSMDKVHSEEAITRERATGAGDQITYIPKRDTFQYLMGYQELY